MTCRYIGKRQQRKMDLAEYAQKSENRAALGEDWLARMADVEKSNPERIKEHEDKAAGKKVDDPVGWALDQYPEDLVCKHAIQALDGQAVTLEEVEAWIEDGLNPAVVRYIAVEVLRESGLIPETKAELGGRLGRFVRILTDAAPVADGDARILFAHRHFGRGLSGTRPISSWNRSPWPHTVDSSNTMRW